MPIAKSRPPKKGSKKAAAASAAKAEAAETVFNVAAMSLDDALKSDPVDDGGRVATGNLASEPRARDVKISDFSLALHGIRLVEDTTIELNAGAHYGLVGRNGCGKSTLLKCFAAREIPIPEMFDIYLLNSEAPPSEQSAIDYVIDSARDEIARIDAQIELVMENIGPDAEELQVLYERLDELDPSTFETRASTILSGLGFSAVENLAAGGAHVTKKTKDMSGGWRMRVALARALFIAPSILLLDEPTNHLDLEACVWLEDYLSAYPKILVIVSHSQDFLNGVCTDIMVMQEHKLTYWSGNYDQYVTTRTERDTNTIKLYKKQQVEIEDIKKFIASCGTYANLVRQAKSRYRLFMLPLQIYILFISSFGL